MTYVSYHYIRSISMLVVTGLFLTFIQPLTSSVKVILSPTSGSPKAA